MVRKIQRPEICSRAVVGSQRWLPLLMPLFAAAPAHAINSHYAQQLERSGCTQVTELQGCDIHKSKAENAKAGFGSTAAPAAAPSAPPAADDKTKTPYGGTKGPIITK